MSEITFWLSPASLYDSGGGASLIGGFSDIDDPHDAIDGRSSYQKWGSAGDGATTSVGWARFALTAPQSGVSINWIRVHYWLWKESAGGFWVSEPIFAGSICPAAGATFYTSTSRTIVDDGGSLGTSGAHGVTNFPSYNLNTGAWIAGTGPAHVYWQWSVDPSDAATWTVSKLQALLVAIAYDAAKGSPNALWSIPPGSSGSSFGPCKTAVLVEVSANTAAAGIEEKRLAGSMYLRLFRDGTEMISQKMPLQAADADMGETIAFAHPAGPSADGEGWGQAPWQRHFGLVLGKTVDLIQKTVEMELLDGWRFHCGLWFPAITDLPYTEEGQGIPYLDAGGGRTCVRSTKGYVKRQLEDVLYVEVPANKEKWTPSGMVVEAPFTAGIVNNSFSQGTTGHTNWTNSTSGSGVVGVTTADYLFDVTGLRRACTLAKGATAGAWAGVTQAYVSPGGGFMRAHFFSKPTTLVSGAGHFYRVQRSSDSWYWNDSTGAFQSTLVDNPLNTSSLIAPNESYSKPFAVTNGVTYTLSVWVYSSGTAAEAMIAYYATLYFSASASAVDFIPTPVVTTTVAVSTAGDAVTVANPATARSLNPLQGTALAKAKINFDHAWMPNGGVKAFASSYVDANNRDAVYYIRDSSTAGRFIFQRNVGGSAYTDVINVTSTSGPGSTSELPQKGDTLALAWRWQQAGGELAQPNYTLLLVVTGLRGGTTIKTATLAAAAWTSVANSTIYLGDNSTSSQWLCAAVFDVEVLPYVLPPDEIYRRLAI